MSAKRSEVATHSTVLTKFEALSWLEKLINQTNQRRFFFNRLVEDEQTQPTKIPRYYKETCLKTDSLFLLWHIFTFCHYLPFC